MSEDNSYRLVESLKKIRNGKAEYDVFYMEKLVEALLKENGIKDVLIELLKFEEDESVIEGNFYVIYLSLIKKIICTGDTNFWDHKIVRNFLQRLLRNATVNDNKLIMNVLFSIYYELEKLNINYEMKEVVEKAFKLLNPIVDDIAVKMTICDYLEEVFKRNYDTNWSSTITELIITNNSQSPARYSEDSDIRRRLSQFLLRNPSALSDMQSEELLLMAKKLPVRIEHVKSEIVSANHHFCKLLAELATLKKLDENSLVDNKWHSIHFRNEILLHLIAVGRTDLIKVVFDTSKLRISDLVKLSPHFDKRGLSLLSTERDVISVCEFIASITNPSILMLDSLYSVLETNKMINPLTLDALLRKSDAWTNKTVTTLVTKAIEQLNSSRWECRDTALNELSVLLKYHHNQSDLIHLVTDMAKNDEEPYVRREALNLLRQIGNPEELGFIAKEMLSLDNDSTPRIAALQILLDGLPETENICLEIIPKILYDEDVAVHRIVIEICAKIIANDKNKELRDLLLKFQEDEVDCFDRLNEILNGKTEMSSLDKENNDLEYLFSTLVQTDDEEFDKDCYDF